MSIRRRVAFTTAAVCLVLGSAVVASAGNRSSHDQYLADAHRALPDWSDDDLLALGYSTCGNVTESTDGRSLLFAVAVDYPAHPEVTDVLDVIAPAAVDAFCADQTGRVELMLGDLGY